MPNKARSLTGCQVVLVWRQQILSHLVESSDTVVILWRRLRMLPRCNKDIGGCFTAKQFNMNHYCGLWYRHNSWNTYVLCGQEKPIQECNRQVCTYTQHHLYSVWIKIFNHLWCGTPFRWAPTIPTNLYTLGIFFKYIPFLLFAHLGNLPVHALWFNFADKEHTIKAHLQYNFVQIG